LHHAALSGSAEVVKYLLDSGADVNVVEEWVGRPLHHAAFRCSVDTVRSLPKNAANVNSCGRRASTLLSITAARSHLAVVEIPLRYGVM
jgi:ankyrin repeat protein